MASWGTTGRLGGRLGTVVRRPILIMMLVILVPLAYLSLGVA